MVRCMYRSNIMIVGEYSVAKNYFSDLSKPRGGIAPALCERP